MTRLRLMMSDPFALAQLHARQGETGDVQVLGGLPARAGRRPRVAPHPVPHRQLNDHAPPQVLARLVAAFDAAVARDPARLRWALSHFERNNRAVTLAENICCHADAATTNGEIAHIHPSDGSMHMVLSASDAAFVVGHSWGERHSLAGIALGLPTTYTLIYAPRDDHEVEIDTTILNAAVTYMVGASGRRTEKR